MKRHLALIINVGILFSNQLFATKCPGYSITNENDTIKVAFNIKGAFIPARGPLDNSQYGVEYYIDDKKTEKLKPGTVKEIMFELEGEKVRMISCVNKDQAIEGFFTSSDGYIFLRILRDGKLKLFVFYRTNTSSPPVSAGSTLRVSAAGFSEEIPKYIFQKSNGDFVKVHGVSFRKDMYFYFFECLELAKKIDDKTFKKTDIERIADYYNSFCR
jgi:hypothetical protein